MNMRAGQEAVWYAVDTGWAGNTRLITACKQGATATTIINVARTRHDAPPAAADCATRDSHMFTTTKPHRVAMTEPDIDELERLEPKARTAPPPKPQRRVKSSMSSSAAATPTSLLCQLMRLKAQQKYLECNQVKLQANNFQDDDNDAEDDEEEGSPPVKGRRGRGPSCVAKVTGLINDIDRLKLELDGKLTKHHSEKRGQLQDMWHFMSTLKEDVYRPERLSQYTVNAVRDRIVGINAQLDRLKAQNGRELEILREEFSKLDRENRFIWNGGE